MCYTPSTSVTTRPVAVVASQSIPIAKIFPQNSGNTTNVADNEVTASQTVQPPSSSVYIHRTLPSPGNYSGIVYVSLRVFYTYPRKCGNYSFVYTRSCLYVFITCNHKCSNTVNVYTPGRSILFLRGP